MSTLVGISPNISQAIIKLGLCTALAFVGCSAAILAALSKNAAGQYDYNTSTVPFIAESLKLILSLWFLAVDVSPESEDAIVLTWASVGRYFVLGLLYTCQNNLLFYTLKHVDAATFQLVGNLKIPLSAFLLHIFLGKKFSTQQNIALVLLVIGAGLSQLNGQSLESGQFLTTSAVGAIFMAIMVGISSGAGVFNEVLLKQGSLGSMHWQNIQLYVFGCVFSYLKMELDLNNRPTSMSAMFAGYNIYTWLSIVNMAFLGIVTSAVLKYADNVLRAFASASSVLLATLMSWQLLGTDISYIFLAGAVVMSLSIMIYTEAWDISGLWRRQATTHERLPTTDKELGQLKASKV
jgi:UDP-sugar transporter A1/2/3